MRSRLLRGRMASHARRQNRRQTGTPGSRRHVPEKLLRIFWCGRRAQTPGKLKKLQAPGVQLYSLSRSCARYRNNDPLDLAFSGSLCHLKREIVLAEKFLGGSVDCDKGRDLNPETLLEVGCAQAPLFHGHLAVCGRCYKFDDRQGPGSTVLADRSENTRIDIRIGFALDLSLYHRRLGWLLRKSERRDHQ